MDNTRNLLVKINGDASGFEKAMGGVEKKSGGIAKAFDKAKTGSFALLGGLTAAAGGAAFFGVQSVQAFNASEQAAVKLRTNLLNVKGATLEHVAALKQQAADLQRVGVIEDDVIIAGQSQLATFNLQGKTIQALTPKIADMVAQLKGHNATAEDMVAINNLVGKVMTGNVGALSRYGVTLSDSQKKLLSQGNETERAAVLNEVLAQNYGKVNEELRKTPQGQITGLKNAFGDLQESVGGFILEAAQPLIDAFGGWIAKVEQAGGLFEYFSGIIDRNKAVVYAVAGAITIALLPAVVALGVGLWTAFAPLLPFIAAGALLGLAIYKLQERFGGIQPLLDKFRPAMELLGRVFRELIWPAIQQVADVIMTRLWPALQRLWDQLAPILIPILKVAAVVLGVTLVAGLWAAINVLRILIGWISNVINWLATAIKWVKDFVMAVGRWFGSIPGSISSALSGVWDAITNPFRRAFDWIEKQTDRVKGFLNKLNPFAKGSPSLVDYVKSGTRVIQSEYGSLFDAINKGAQGISGEGLAMSMPGTAVGPTAPVEASSAVFQPTLHINVGMYAGMPVEKRQIAVELWREVVREARAQGVQLPQIGVSPQ